MEIKQVLKPNNREVSKKRYSNDVKINMLIWRLKPY